MSNKWFIVMVFYEDGLKVIEFLKYKGKIITRTISRSTKGILQAVMLLISICEISFLSVESNRNLIILVALLRGFSLVPQGK